MDRLNVNGDDPVFGDHPKSPVAMFVNAHQWDVNASLEGRYAHACLHGKPMSLNFLQEHSRIFQVHDPPDIAFRTPPDGEDVA